VVREVTGTASADHLYLKRDLTGWLGQQDLPALASLPEAAGLPVGSVVELELGAGGRLKAYLGNVRPDWRNPALLLLGPGIEADFVAVAPCRYVNRFRYTTDGAQRRISVGTQTLAEGTQWFSLGQCRMTPEGLVTPLVERLLAERDALLRQAATITAVRLAEHPPPATPRAAVHGAAELEGFTRRLAAGMRAGETRHVQALLDAAPRLLDILPREQALRVGERLEEAATWLSGQRARRGAVFVELALVLDAGRFTRLEPVLREAESFNTRDLSPTESRLLARARSARTQRVLAPGTVRPAKIVPQQRTKAARQRAAAHDVHELLRRLASEASRMRPVRLRAAVTRLAAAAAQADQALEPATRREVQDWLSRTRSRGPRPADPGPRPEQQAKAPPPRKTGERRLPRPTAAGAKPTTTAKPAPAGSARLPAAALEHIAAAVRGALKKAARERSATSWTRLRRQLDRALPDLHPDDEVEVLVRVEANTESDEPLLSSLLAAGDRDSPALYRALADRMGRALPSEAAAARWHWQTETLRLYELFRYR
jgi:hypothetical protein